MLAKHVLVHIVCNYYIDYMNESPEYNGWYGMKIEEIQLCKAMYTWK